MGDAVSGTIARFQSLADGTVRLSVDLHAKPGAEFLEVGQSVALALLQSEPVAGADEPVREFGHYALTLKLSGFMFRPDVWRAIGTDETFRRWVAGQPCVVRQGCEGDVVAAHVRRIADGAGTGIKPEYACIPLCHLHHGRQHALGESTLGGKQQFDEWRVRFVTDWAWHQLKVELGYESMAQVPPTVLLAWAQKHGVDQHLPLAYREVVAA